MAYASKLSLAIRAANSGEVSSVTYPRAERELMALWSVYIERLRKTSMATHRVGKECVRRIFNVGTIGHRG